MDKIICVGKNYLDHAKELGDAVPENPVLFLKPPSVLISASVLGQSLTVSLPQGQGPVHHECEIVAKVNHSGKIEAVTLGLDMTLRAVQDRLKKAGHPWEISKVFAGSAIIGAFIPINEIGNYLSHEFQFKLDGAVKQSARGVEMRVNPQSCIEYAAKHFPLRDGDLLFTGTPAGVGPVQNGQRAELYWDGKLILSVVWS